MDDNKWIRVSDYTPPTDVFVETKVDDTKGCRNIQKLKLSGRLWFGKDGMYVYYTPTHWRPIR